MKKKINIWKKGSALLAHETTVPPSSHTGAESAVMDADLLLCLALDVGEHMLRCGAEIHRVENTMERICLSYGASHVEVFSIISLIIASVRLPNGSYSSQIRRIYRTSTNLYRLERFNDISRRICRENPSFAEAQTWIAEAKKSKPYPDWIVVLGMVLVAGASAVFFGGTMRDSIAASIIGLFFAGMERFASKNVNRMARTVLQSFLMGLLAYLSVRIGLGQNLGAVTIGTIMLLIPGLDFGNALRDLLGSELLSGTLRIVQTCLVAIMIAFGYAAAFLVMGGIFQ